MSTETELIYSELLVLRCRRGDQAAMEELIRRWERRLFYYIRRLVDDEEDAWDVLQDTWVKVIRGIGSLREANSFPAWLYRIARNTAMSRLRRRYADLAFLEAVEPHQDPGTNSMDFSFEDAERVHSALGKLPVPQREVLTLQFLEDLSIEEIAEVVGAAPGTIKSRLHFAKRALRKVLEEDLQ